ncbi:uncharacterized protein LOC142333610 [Lycorma delicatula]|uniref:uncharacterized protein LOC142333610 n=1 Tax=Lycorma delicatula TaxID=130591 RepID=UPI003F519331
MNLQERRMFKMLLRCFGLRKDDDVEYPYELYIKIVKMTMRINGLWISENNRNLNLIQVIPYCAIMTIGILAITASIYDTRKDFTTSTETLLYEILLIHSFNAYLILIYNLKTINRMMTAIETRFNNFEKRALNKETRIKKSSEDGSINLTKFVTTVVCSVHVSHTLASKFYIPSSETKTLFFSIILPYDLHEYYYVAFGLESAIYVIEAIVNLSSITVSVGFLNILCGEFDILGKSLENIYDKRHKGKINTDIDVKLTKLSVKEIIYHHISLIR